MASTSDVTYISRATSISSSINSSPLTIQDVPEFDSAERNSYMYKSRIHIPSLGFICLKCGSHCFTDEQWEYHNYYYHGEHQYLCTEQTINQLCAFTYSYEYELFLHVMKVHKPGSYYCAICVTPLSTKVDYKLHALTDHSVYYIHYFESGPDMTPDPHLDFILDLEFDKRDLPSRTRLRDPVYSCFKCTSPELSPMTFRELLKHHKEKHSPAYPCPVCPAEYFTFEQLNAHKISHYTLLQDYYCQICNTRFTSRKTFETHSVKVHDKRLYTCELCGTSYGYLHTFKAHNQYTHGKTH